MKLITQTFVEKQNSYWYTEILLKRKTESQVQKTVIPSEHHSTSDTTSEDGISH